LQCSRDAGAKEPHDPLTFFGPIKALDAKMSILEGTMPGGLGLGEVLSQWEE